jgi:hypothetical protein
LEVNESANGEKRRCEMKFKSAICFEYPHIGIVSEILPNQFKKE